MFYRTKSNSLSNDLSIYLILNILMDYRSHTYEKLSFNTNSSIYVISEMIQSLAKNGLILELKKKNSFN